MYNVPELVIACKKVIVVCKKIDTTTVLCKSIV